MNKPVRPPPPSDPPTDAELGPPPAHLRDLTEYELAARELAMDAGRSVAHARVAAWLDAVIADPAHPPPPPQSCDR